jgi:hypothetical protein
MSMLKEMVSGPATFAYYRDGELWYSTHDGFYFPVPITDIGTATFNAEEKGILMMRYIRKHLKLAEQAREARNVDQAS